MEQAGKMIVSTGNWVLSRYVVTADKTELKIIAVGLAFIVGVVVIRRIAKGQSLNILPTSS